VTKGDERFDRWEPAPGHIVRLKRGFKGSIEDRAFKRASEEGGARLELDEKTLYEVLKCERNGGYRALHLQAVKIIYIAGERFVAKGNKVPYPVAIELFELAHEHNIIGKPRPGL